MTDLAPEALEESQLEQVSEPEKGFIYRRVGASRGEKSALGITTKSTSPPQGEKYSKEDKKAFGDGQKVLRYALLSVVRSILNDSKVNNKGYIDKVWRVANCRRSFGFGKKEVEMRKNPVLGKGWLSGLYICGSVHVCPVDAFTVGQKRGKELTEAILKKNCGQAFLVVTARHNRAAKCADLYKLLQKGLSFAMSGAPYQRFAKKWKIIGTVTGWDYTASLQNGHHPHKNILFISSLPSLENDEFEKDLEAIADRFKKFLEDSGVYTNSHTTKVLTNKKDCANYMTKWALTLEVAQIQRKQAKDGHFTQFQLLYEIGFGDLDPETRAGYIALFREFAEASKGKRQLVYSKHLRDWLGLGKDKTDEELADEGEDPSYVLGNLTRDQYKLIFKKELQGSIPKLGNVIAHCDTAGVWDYLEAEYGIVGTPAQRDPQPGVMFIVDGEDEPEKLHASKHFTEEEEAHSREWLESLYPAVAKLRAKQEAWLIRCAEIEKDQNEERSWKEDDDVSS